jgi:hypothetical protein
VAFYQADVRISFGAEYFDEFSFYMNSHISVIVQLPPRKDKFHCLDKFTVFMNSFDEFTFYMNPYISEHSICVFNEFIYSVFISFNK